MLSYLLNLNIVPKTKNQGKLRFNICRIQHLPVTFTLAYHLVLLITITMMYYLYLFITFLLIDFIIIISIYLSYLQ